MNNFIELNLKDSRTSLSEIDNISHLKVLRTDLRLFKDERIDMTSKRLTCIDCGSNKVPIAVNGYCSICNEINKHLNY
jgi:hypothetical protein